MTLWRFLGIPQGFQRIGDARLNRSGNFPGLERKPPLKPIAHPDNLLSNNPAIKKRPSSTWPSSAATSATAASRKP
jgi:hypothetical protein